MLLYIIHIALAAIFKLHLTVGLRPVSSFMFLEHGRGLMS